MAWSPPESGTQVVEASEQPRLKTGASKEPRRGRPGPRRRRKWGRSAPRGCRSWFSGPRRRAGNLRVRRGPGFPGVRDSVKDKREAPGVAFGHSWDILVLRLRFLNRK